MSDLNKLYHPVIKAHQANPFHFKKIDDAEKVVKSNNPICGDRFDFFIDIHEGKITSLHYHGYGCAVSVATGSVLVKSLEGKNVIDAITLCTSFIDLLNGRSSTNNIPDELKAFVAVRDFPSRYDCAAMAWEEMREFLMATKP